MCSHIGNVCCYSDLLNVEVPHTDYLISGYSSFRRDHFAAIVSSPFTSPSDAINKPSRYSRCAVRKYSHFIGLFEFRTNILVRYIYTLRDTLYFCKNFLAVSPMWKKNVITVMHTLPLTLCAALGLNKQKYPSTCYVSPPQLANQ